MFVEIVKSFSISAVTTKPDISFAARFLEHFNNCFIKTYWTAAKRVLRYFKRSMYLGINCKPDNERLKGFIDGDWGNNLDDRRSCTGYSLGICWQTDILGLPKKTYIFKDFCSNWDFKDLKTCYFRCKEQGYRYVTPFCS